MIVLDGSHGEGGGAILRQALALSTLTGKPFEIINIRKNRPQPGLKAQHIESIMALEKISSCTILGDCKIGSESLKFIPGEIKNKSVDIDIGTAGSITLLMQSVLLPIVFSKKKVTLNITGGTDVKWSQPIDHFTNVLVPRLREFADIDVKLLKRGYYPKGGGQVSIFIRSKKTASEAKVLELVERGELLQVKGTAHSSIDLEPSEVSDRIADRAKDLLIDLKVPVMINRQYNKSESSGAGISLWALFSNTTDGFPMSVAADSLGEKNKSSSEVGSEVAKKLKEEMMSGAAVDEHLADQLIPFLGVCTGAMKTSRITEHTKSNIKVVEEFLDVKFDISGQMIYAKKLEKKSETENSSVLEKKEDSLNISKNKIMEADIIKKNLSQLDISKNEKQTLLDY